MSVCLYLLCVIVALALELSYPPICLVLCLKKKKLHNNFSTCFKLSARNFLPACVRVLAFYVLCIDNICTDGEEDGLRLRGFPSSLGSVGRVEVCHDSIWGLICASHWGENETKVVCKQLGHHAASALLISTKKVKEMTLSKLYTPPVLGRKRWLHGAICKTGKENNLRDCPFDNRKYTSGSSAQCEDPAPACVSRHCGDRDKRNHVAAVACLGK